MNRGRPSTQHPATARPEATVDIKSSGDIALLSVSGLVDERFRGFGAIGALKAVVIDVSGITRMTSFGVRQWLKAMDALPKGLSELLLLGCPTFFVDQLNMVLNFGGASKIVTVVAPYTCPSCGAESVELIDVLAERANLANGSLPDKECTRCGGKLEFDETPESYFSFVSKYGASRIQPATAQLLASHGLYEAVDNAPEKPPTIIKLVHGSVTYFRIIGRIGSMFRARPFLVGAEGEVVIDLAQVDKLEPAGDKEWRRLLTSLSGQVPSVTLVDVKLPFLAAASSSLRIGENIAVASLLVPYVCITCGRRSQQRELLDGLQWPPDPEVAICTACEGALRRELAPTAMAQLSKPNTNTPVASALVIAQRDEILSRALNDANVAPVESATASASDAILGKYKIVRRLSSGGLAEVFLAKQVGIGGFEKPVVLKKILPARREQAVDRLLAEVKLAGRLTYPNIVQLLDVGEFDGAMYLAMEYVHGKNLSAIIERLHSTNASMPVADVCYVVREVAQALDHAYWSTDVSGQLLCVVHGDVAPHNIMLSYDGAVKVLDFGVARSVGKQPELQYMAPESTAEEQIDHRSDLFSLGVLLYELCSGSKPFPGSTHKEIVKKIRAGKYRPLREVAGVPDTVAELVARLLSPNADDRPQRGQEVVAKLTDIMRRFRLESSGPSIARLVSRVFPDDTHSDIALARTDKQPISIPLPSVSAISIPRTRSSELGIDTSISISAEDRDPATQNQNRAMRSASAKRSPIWALILAIAIIAGLAIAAYVYRIDIFEWPRGID